MLSKVANRVVNRIETCNDQAAGVGKGKGFVDRDQERKFWVRKGLSAFASQQKVTIEL